jgi:hypothetical protein
MLSQTTPRSGAGIPHLILFEVTVGNRWAVWG